MVKFTKDGKFLMQVGTKRQGLTADSNSWERFYEVAKIFDDPKTNELYLADGYGNSRVAVIDGDSGKILRFWGAYGNKPDDGPSGLRPGGAAVAAVPRPGPLCGHLQRPNRLRLRPPEQSDPILHT